MAVLRTNVNKAKEICSTTTYTKRNLQPPTQDIDLLAPTINSIAAVIPPSDEKEAVTDITIPIFPFKNGKENEDAYTHGLESIAKIIELLNTTQEGPYDELAIIQKKKLLEAVQQMGTTPSIPNLFERELGNTSINQILDAKTPTQAGEHLLDYLKNLPRNDYLLQRFTQGFLLAPYGSYKIKYPEIFGESNSEQIRHLFQAQYYLVQKLFLPALSPNFPPDTAFDKKFLQIFNNFDSNLRDSYIARFLETIISGVSNEFAFQPGLTAFQKAQQDPFFAHVFMHHFDTTKNASMLFDLATQNLLRDKWQYIEANWQQRFGNTEIIQSLHDILESSFTHTDLRKINAEQVTQEVYKSFSAETIEQLTQKEKEIRAVTSTMWEQAKKTIAYWPPAYKKIFLHTDKDSLAYQIGIKKFQFIVQTPENPTSVLIHFGESAFGVACSISPTGVVTQLPNALTPGVKALIEQLVVGSFADLIQSRKVFKMRNISQPNNSSIQEEPKQAKEEKKPQNPRRTRRGTVVPTINTFYIASSEGKTLGEEFFKVEEVEVVKMLEEQQQEERVYKTRTVRVHKQDRALAYNVKTIARELIQLHQSGAIPVEKKQALWEAIQHVKKMSPKKTKAMEQLSPAFKNALQYITLTFATTNSEALSANNLVGI